MPIIKTAVQQQWELIDPIRRHITPLERAIVDGGYWYTIRCSKEAATWLRAQDDCKWHQHIDHNWYTISNTFDVDEETYIMMKLQWGE